MAGGETTETIGVAASTAKIQEYCPVAMRVCPEVKSADCREASRLVTRCTEMSARLEPESTLITDGACGALMLKALAEANLAKYTQEGAQNA